MVSRVGTLQCALGEGLLWDPAAALLLMVDILGQRLIAVDVEDGAHREWPMPAAIGWVLPTQAAQVYAVGLKSGVARVNLAAPSELIWVNRQFPPQPDCRLNDACTDATGRIWYGSMNDADSTRAAGQLASLSAGRTWRIHDRGFTVTNGPLISPDGKHLYLNDSGKGIVYRYDLALAQGELSGRRIFAAFSADRGLPDGMCFDTAGNLWLALWGSGQVLKLDARGNILNEYAIPAPNVTNVCFGGADLDRLFVSSASIELSDQMKNRFPHSGGLFELTGHGSRGFAPHPASLEAR